MKLAIFGATGRTGQLLVAQAIEAGHAVNALARTPSKFSIQHENLKVIAGDILTPAHVDATVQGTDVVLSALGPTSNKPTFTISQGMRHILDAMQKHNVARIILATGAGVRDPLDHPKFIDHVFGFLLKLISKNVVADMARAVELVRQSDRAWTVVRVPRLLDGASQGTLKVGYVGDINPQITRADMAAFMLRQVDDPQYIRKAPAISN